MALNTPQILFGQVMHKRLTPKVNGFQYPIYYLSCSLDALEQMNDGWRFGVNRRGWMSFYTSDHGARDGTDLKLWINNILRHYQCDHLVSDVTLIAMPRILGYVFNPVSFWLCLDHKQRLIAVLCEVNNTFGETHSYLCYHDDHRPIGPDDWLCADKLFHVSPFLPRQGSYKFRFAINNDKVGIWIDYMDGDGAAQLLTALTGKLAPYTRRTRARAFWGYPLVTFMAIYRIHRQAVRLWLKGIRYVPRPQQNVEKLSATDKITKN